MEILGFVVLTGPLFFGVVWLLISIWIAVIISKRSSRKIMSIGAVFAIFVLPFSDQIIGKIVHNNLCKNKAGVIVYQTIELPAEYWDEYGKPIFIRENGDLNISLLNYRYKESAEKTTYSGVLGIDQYRPQVIIRDNKEVIGEVVNYMFWGGLILRNLNPAPSAVDCEDFHGNVFWANFYSSLFRRPE